MSITLAALNALPRPAFNMATDPVWFAHQYAQPLDQECVAFIAAMFAYGQRRVFMPLLAQLLQPLGSSPVNQLQQWHATGRFAHCVAKHVPPFIYRFNTQADYYALLARLACVYAQAGSLQHLLQNADRGTGYQMWLSHWMNDLIGPEKPASYGLNYLLAHPARNGSCKRLHLFLRWMSRGPDDIDLGLWANTLTPDQLLVPLDTHVLKAAQHLGWVNTKTANWKTAEAITAQLRLLCPQDPVSLDVALFQLGQTL
jgi:uncharacterized protein (TIGR02757 family)